jgi:glutathione S-transferase
VNEITLFGGAYSVYVRTVRLILAEKGLAYAFREIDVFAEGGPPKEYLARQPFGRIPALEHAGFRLYETGAIIRYIEAAFPEPSLVPSDLRQRARMDQILSILDGYAYRCWVWDIYVERISKPSEGGTADEARIAAALPQAAKILDAIAELTEGGPYFSGADPTLADLHALPMLAYFRKTPEGRDLLAERPFWQDWWRVMAARSSFAATDTH